jgi:glycosyltransferase involved in cell wall biosynthesis
MTDHKPAPRVSVILTSYNHEKFVSQAIESVINQTFVDYELIIADDLSSDGSWEIIKSYKDSRIRFFRSEKTERGLINKVLRSGMVRGQYVAIHHSDDVWEHNKLTKQVALLDSEPEVAAVFTNATIIDEEGGGIAMQNDNPTAQSYFQIFNKADRSRHEWLNYFFYHKNCLCHPSLMIRKECYDSLGYYNMNYRQTADFEFWTRLCMRKEIKVLSEPLVRFRVLNKERNTSSYTLDNVIRDRFEYSQIIKNFLQIEDAEEIMKIFPKAEQYQSGDSGVAKYLLARIAIDSNIKEAQIFGLEILASLMADEKMAKQCLESHGFSLSDYFQLTGKTNVFSIAISPPGATSKLGIIVDRIVADLHWWRKNWRERLNKLLSKNGMGR